MFENVSIIHVFFMRGREKIPMGRLALKDRKILFEYDAQMIQTKLELSPFMLPLKTGVMSCEDRAFDGLFGVFNDSLPDGWGRLLLDRKLMKMGVLPQNLSPLDRLRYVGNHGMGALVYEPEVETYLSHHYEDLDLISEETYQFQENDRDTFVDELFSMNGSSTGARPKIMMDIGDEKWIIKFRSMFDPKDIGPIEYAYHLMAIDANLHVPVARLFPSKIGQGYFGVKRFDRVKNDSTHMHTMSGLLHADHRIPSLDYETIMKATLWLTKDLRECEKQFRAAVFNILSHNRDDHSKNFSFLMNKEGEWSVSPAYDLTFSSGPNGEHCTTVMGEGRNPTQAHILKIAEIVGIKKARALEIINEVKEATLKWSEIASHVGVSAQSTSLIQKSLENVRKAFFI